MFCFVLLKTGNPLPHYVVTNKHWKRSCQVTPRRRVIKCDRCIAGGGKPADSTDMALGDSPNVLLGRIRFLNKCIECFRKSEPVPESLCYVPNEVCYKICKDSSSASSASSSTSAGTAGTPGKTVVSVFEAPTTTNNKKLCKYNIEPKKGTCIRTTGDEYCNSQGLWVKLNKVGVWGSNVITSKVVHHIFILAPLHVHFTHHQCSLIH